MEKTTYTLGEHYILCDFKIKEEQSNDATNKLRAKIPKINIDPKLRLSALNSISDGSSYFRNRLNEIEKSIDTNRINIDTINSAELQKLKNHLSKNLESEIKSADKGTDYIINIINLFIEKNWNELIDKLLLYIFNYSTNTGFEMNIPFLLQIYRIGNEHDNYSIKSKVYQYLQNNNLSNFINYGNQKLIEDFPELSANEMALNDTSINSIQIESELTNNENSDENYDFINSTSIPDLNQSQAMPTRNISERSSGLNQTTFAPRSMPNTQVNPRSVHMPMSKSPKIIHITNYNAPFISNSESPIRYLKFDSGLIYLFGILEVGTISSMAEQNQQTLFKLPPDCCPKYKINLFINEKNTSYSTFGRDGPSVANIIVNVDGRLIYKSNDILNWSTNKIRLFFDGTIICIN